VQTMIARPSFALSCLVVSFAVFVLAVEVSDSPNLPRAKVCVRCCVCAVVTFWMFRTHPALIRARTLLVCDQVPGFNDQQPQYAYSIGAIGIVLLYAALSVGIRQLAANGKALSIEVIAAFVSAEAVVLGFGACLRFALIPPPFSLRLKPRMLLIFGVFGFVLSSLCS
jgi:hypothetical protein